MSGIALAGLLGAVSGVVGTGIGGIAAAANRKPGPGSTSGMLGFSGGVMLAVTLIDLIPEALRVSFIIGIASIIAGVFSMWWTDRVLPGRETDPSSRYSRAGAVVGLGIASHNFAEGLAVGSSYASTVQIGIEIAVLIGIHDIPEGMAMATMLRLGGASRISVILAAVAAGLPMGAGAVAGAIAGSLSAAGLAFSLGSASGAMLYVTARLYPEGLSLSHLTALMSGTILGLASGIFLAIAL